MSNIRAVFFSILPFSFRVADFASTITEFFSNGFANEIPCEGSVAHSAVAEPRRRPNEREMTKFFVRQIAHFPVSDFLNCFLCGGIIESLWLWSTRFCSMIDQCRSSSVWNNWTKLRAPTSNSEGGNESWEEMRLSRFTLQPNYFPFLALKNQWTWMAKVWRKVDAGSERKEASTLEPSNPISFLVVTSFYCSMRTRARKSSS